MNTRNSAPNISSYYNMTYTKPCTVCHNTIPCLYISMSTDLLFLLMITPRWAHPRLNVYHHIHTRPELPSQSSTYFHTANIYTVCLKQTCFPMQFVACFLSFDLVSNHHSHGTYVTVQTAYPRRTLGVLCASASHSRAHPT